MIPAVLRLVEDDFSDAARYVLKEMREYGKEETIDGYSTEEMVILGFGSEFIRVYLGDPQYAEKGLSWCRSLNGAIHGACIEGLSVGHMKYGSPEHSYDSLRSFCSLDSMREGERDACYKHVLLRLRNWYEIKKAEELCRQAPSPYREKYCTRYESDNE